MSLWRFSTFGRVNAHIAWLMSGSILSLGPSKSHKSVPGLLLTENLSITHVCKLTLQVLPMYICKTLPDSLICPAATLLNEISYTRVEIVAYFGVTLRENDISDISICSAIDDSVTRSISLSLVHISDISLLLITNSLHICIFMYVYILKYGSSPSCYHWSINYDFLKIVLDSNIFTSLLTYAYKCRRFEGPKYIKELHHFILFSNNVICTYTNVFTIHCDPGPVLLIWYNFNPSMDK